MGDLDAAKVPKRTQTGDVAVDDLTSGSPGFPIHHLKPALQTGDMEF